MEKVIVIGSGIAGLATAIRLANKGFKVEVFEANDHPGGKIWELKSQGFRFDAGPSLFTLPELVDELFKISGEDPAAHFRYYRKEVICRYFWETGKELTAWADADRFAKAAGEIFHGSEKQVLTYLQQACKKYQLTENIFLRRSLHKLRSYLSLQVLKGIGTMRSLHLHQSLNHYNSRMFDHPELVQLFNRFATYNGSDPYQTPGVMGMIPHLEHNLGTYFPNGGMYNIVKALTSLAKRLGITFHFNSRVSRIEVKDGRVRGVKVAGDFHQSEYVICNSDIVTAYRELMPSQPAPERILKQERSSSAMVFFWGMDKKFPQLDLHNIFFSENSRQEFEAIFHKGVISSDPTIYINITSKEVPTDAPQGCENWFVMVNAPADTGQNWEQIAAVTRRNLIKKLSRILKLPVERHICWESRMLPTDIANNTGSYRGALYGTSSNSRLSAFLRHPNFSSRIRGLFFCGGSVHPGGGIPLCLLSGQITADLVGKASKSGNGRIS